VSLVRGKNGWRAAGATALLTAKGSPEVLAAFARISELAMRFVGVDENNEYIFQTLMEAHEALINTPDAYPTIEIMCVARILYSLGYISAEALKSTLFSHTAYQAAHLTEAEALTPELLRSINNALAETHL
jgi:citrate lyase synthetase